MKRFFTVFFELLLIFNSAFILKGQFNKITVQIFQGNTSATLQQTVSIKHNVSITDIIIEEENVPILKKDSFSGLVNLQAVIIRRSNLSSVEENVFKNLNTLRKVNLNFNKLNRIHDKTFNNPRLVSISLKGNGIKSFSSKTFNDLPNLQFLDLSDNNIENIPKDAFKHTGNIRILDLSYNKLRHYPAISYTPYSYFEQAFANAVKHERVFLDLSFNNFTFISYYLLRDIYFIEEIRLNGNNIKSISDYAFDNLKWAKSVHIENNNLETLSDRLLIGLEVVEELKLANNPWTQEFVCNYRNWCEKNNKTNYLYDISCLIYYH